MLTRREFVQVAGIASLGAATAECGSIPCPPRDEPTYLGLPSAAWLARLVERHTVKYDPHESPDESSRERVYEAVAAFGELVVPALRRLLARGREPGRTGALRVLSRMGPLGKSVLLDAARDVRGNLRAVAIFTLAYAFPESAELQPLLLAGLDDDVPEVRLRAVNSLWFLNADCKPILVKALQNSDAEVRCRAVREVVRMDANPSFGIPLLVGLLNDPSLEVCSAAVENLFLFRPVDARVVPAILGLIHEGKHALANYLPHAGERGFDEALRLLTDNDVSKRAAAASALAEFVCGDNPGSNKPLRQLSNKQSSELLLACRRAAYENDLAVSFPAGKVVEAISTLGCAPNGCDN